MNICGMLVHALPERQAHVVELATALPGVEIHEVADAGRIVLTVEDSAAGSAFDTMTTIHRLDGVVAAGLVYHHFEPEAA